MPNYNEQFPSEKRRGPRVGGTMAEYSIEGEGVVRKALIKDICADGLCIYMPQAVENEAVVYLKAFLFDDETPVEVQGRVVWHSPGGYFGYNDVGIEFLDMSKEDHAQIAAYVKKSLQREEGV